MYYKVKSYCKREFLSQNVNGIAIKLVDRSCLFFPSISRFMVVKILKRNVHKEKIVVETSVDERFQLDFGRQNKSKLDRIDDLINDTMENLG